MKQQQKRYTTDQQNELILQALVECARAHTSHSKTLEQSAKAGGNPFLSVETATALSAEHTCVAGALHDLHDLLTDAGFEVRLVEEA